MFHLTIKFYPTRSQAFLEECPEDTYDEYFATEEEALETLKQFKQGSNSHVRWDIMEYD